MGFVFDPQANLDFEFDWSQWLEDTEQITTQTVTSDGDLTVSQVTQTGGVVKCWLSGGTLGSTQRVTCHITTNMGRQDDRTLSVRVVDR